MPYLRSMPTEKIYKKDVTDALNSDVIDKELVSANAERKCYFGLFEYFMCVNFIIIHAIHKIM